MKGDLSNGAWLLADQAMLLTLKSLSLVVIAMQSYGYLLAALLEARQTHSGTTGMDREWPSALQQTMYTTTVATLLCVIRITITRLVNVCMWVVQHPIRGTLAGTRLERTLRVAEREPA